MNEKTTPELFAQETVRKWAIDTLHTKPLLRRRRLKVFARLHFWPSRFEMTLANAQAILVRIVDV